MKRVYLDANATTPLDPRVRAAMEPYLDCGNASSPHAEGRAARDAIDRARADVAALIGVVDQEIVFTSGGTESNGMALLGGLRASGKNRALCSAVEHPSVLRTLLALRPATDIVVAPVDRGGRVDADLEIPEDTGIVSIMRANNETGAIQPVAPIAARAAAAGALMHTDAVQACGKIPVSARDLGVHMLSMSAHKFHGPKGVGALWVSREVKIGPLYHGGEHERGLRSGTENVGAVVGFGEAARIARQEMEARLARWRELGATLEARIRAEVPQVIVNSPEDPGDRVPNTLNVTIPGVEGEAALLGVDLEGFAVATGSACSSGAAEPSHVLRAMGLSEEHTEQSLRISMHAQTCEKDVISFVNTLARVVKNLRALSV
ncbi:MAG: cysteine desulfurase family protein [Planctomycetota bacterium]